MVTTPQIRLTPEQWFLTFAEMFSFSKKMCVPCKLLHKMSEHPEAPSVRATVTFAYVLSVSPPSTPREPKIHKGSNIVSFVPYYSLEQTKVRS